MRLLPSHRAGGCLMLASLERVKREELHFFHILASCLSECHSKCTSFVNAVLMIIAIDRVLVNVVKA